MEANGKKALKIVQFLDPRTQKYTLEKYQGRSISVTGEEAESELRKEEQERITGRSIKISSVESSTN